MLSFKEFCDLNFLCEGSTSNRLKEKYGIEQFEKISSDSTVYQIGYAPKSKKWYGWSHRAIFGFGVGSKVKVGDCGYQPSNKEEFLESIKKWYSDRMYKNVHYEITKEGVSVTYEIHPKKGGAVLQSAVFEKFPKNGEGVNGQQKH